MIFTAVISFIIAALSGMGVGGGGLFVVFLALFTDLPQITVQGINLLFFLFSSGSSICVHLTKRRIFGTAVLVMAAFGVLGSVCGALLANVIGQTLLRRIFGIMLVISGMLSLRQSLAPTTTQASEERRR